MTSHAQDLQIVRERLEKVERQYHRLKSIVTVGLVIAGTILVMGQTLPKSRTVEAERFFLRDKDGNRHVGGIRCC